jgi:hypothetical protein
MWVNGNSSIEQYAKARESKKAAGTQKVQEFNKNDSDHVLEQQPGAELHEH